MIARFISKHVELKQRVVPMRIRNHMVEYAAGRIYFTLFGVPIPFDVGVRFYVVPE